MFNKKKQLTDRQYYSRLSRTFATTSKQLLWIIVINSIIWIYFSYILAYMGKDQIAETLSSNICNVLLGNIVSYVISKTVENVFQYNGIGGTSTYIDPYNNRTQQNIIIAGSDQSNTSGTIVTPTVPTVTNPTEVITATTESNTVTDSTSTATSTLTGVDPELNPSVSTKQNTPESGNPEPN